MFNLAPIVSRGTIFPLALLLALPLLVATRLEGATRVDLTVDEALPDRQVDWPVTTGVPFPRGALADEKNCRLIDERRNEVLLQTKVAATWDAARSSIRWLTIDFIAQPGRRYALEFGPDVRRRAPATPLSVTPGAAPRVATGSLIVDFSPSGPSALAGARIDLNGNGTIEAGEVVLAAAEAGEHRYVDQHGTAFTSQQDREGREIVVEQTGPVRAVVRVDGWYTGPDGARIVGYRTRYHLFAGLGLIRLVDEFRIVGSTRETQFADIALGWGCLLDERERRVAFDPVDGHPGEPTRVRWSDRHQGIESYQETYRHYGNLESRGGVVERTREGERRLIEGERSGGWLQVADRRAAVTGGLRWFWQQFPKSWEVSDAGLSIHLWSPRGGSALDFGRAGIERFMGPTGLKYLLDWQGVRANRSPIEEFFYFAGRNALDQGDVDGLGTRKHHELLLHVAPAAQAAAGVAYGRLVERPPLVLAGGSWNCGTDVFGPLAARPNDSPYEAIVDRLFGLQRYAQDAFGDYGWWLFGAGPHYSYQWDAATGRHYADPRRFENHTYQRDTQLWWNYLRSGERKFHDWAIPAENHWVDISVSHARTTYTTDWRGGRAEQRTMTWPVGDWSIDSPLHHVRHHDTGEAWLRSASQFWATYHRTLETTTLAYYLTGDERFQDVIDYWRNYWGDLAGCRSDSSDVPPWHREQVWFTPTRAGEPSLGWAQMLRDYAPFQSGSRHQMTLWFNLSTLYEHTWDPRIGQVLREYADMFIDPDAPAGVWQCQDHRLPAHSSTPMLAHYWAPALWKYARATQDPRMPEVLKKYFTACLWADPYGGDVGIYSNVQIAYGWYFTRDPRHLATARRELIRLEPNGRPLDKPEDLGPRIYNPHSVLQSLTATPRLIAALDDAVRSGITPPMPRLSVHRTAIALEKSSGSTPLKALCWGYDDRPRLLDAQGREPAGVVWNATRHGSHLQPFDRLLPGFAVYEVHLTLPADAPAGIYVVEPQLELGILSMEGGRVVALAANDPIRLEPGERLWLAGKAGEPLRLESAQPAAWRVFDTPTASPQPGKVEKYEVVWNAPDGASKRRGIEHAGSGPLWFRQVNGDGACWGLLEPTLDERLVAQLPRWQPRRPTIPAEEPRFVPGRFGQGVLLVPGREMHIPDAIVDTNGTQRRLSDMKQGTLECWVQRWWDERLGADPNRPLLLTNGQQQAMVPFKRLPYGEWAHLAIVWRPALRPGNETWVHIYINGVDQANYRSIDWAGYGDRPMSFSVRDWLEKFVARAQLSAPFAIDELRLSSEPRYLDPAVDFGRQQTFNPHHFTPPDAAWSQADAATLLRMSFDGDLKGTAIGNVPVEGTFIGAR